jgi:hypothetical protein
MRVLALASVLLAGAAGLLCSCGGDETTPPVADAGVGPAEWAVTQEDHFRSMLRWMDDYAAALEGCMSEGSVIATIRELDALYERLEQIHERTRSLGAPSMEEQLRLKEGIGEEAIRRVVTPLYRARKAVEDAPKTAYALGPAMGRIRDLEAQAFPGHDPDERPASDANETDTRVQSSAEIEIEDMLEEPPPLEEIPEPEANGPGAGRK